MGADRWVVVLVRAWWDDGQFRARLITTRDGEQAVCVVGSAEEAAERLREWLDRPPTG